MITSNIHKQDFVFKCWVNEQFNLGIFILQHFNPEEIFRPLVIFLYIKKIKDPFFYSF